MKKEEILSRLGDEVLGSRKISKTAILELAIESGIKFEPSDLFGLQ